MPSTKLLRLRFARNHDPKNDHYGWEKCRKCSIGQSEQLNVPVNPSGIVGKSVKALSCTNDVGCDDEQD